MTTLLTDEFDQLTTGMFSALVGAHTEYHYLPEAAPHGNWNVACFASGQGAGTAWRIRETDDGKDLVQTFKSKRADTHPMVIAGLAEWKDYTVEVGIRASREGGTNWRGLQIPQQPMLLLPRADRNGSQHHQGPPRIGILDCH